MKTNMMRWIGLALCLTPFGALAVGEAEAALTSECRANEELCEQACLNLEEGTTEEQFAGCYVECGARAESCRAVAQ